MWVSEEERTRMPPVILISTLRSCEISQGSWGDIRYDRRLRPSGQTFLDNRLSC